MNRLQILSRRIAKLQVEFALEKQIAKQQAEVFGSTEYYTVYKVRKTTIKRHKRKGFTAIRVRK
jgi:hypothetical protein